MAKLNDMRSRMLNWADWKVKQGDGAGRYTRMKWGAPLPDTSDPWSLPPIRPAEEDAWEIDKALRQIELTSELRATVECYYLDRRQTERQKLERLQVAKSTMMERLDRVDLLLARHFSGRNQQAKSERARVEALKSAQAR